MSKPIKMPEDIMNQIRVEFEKVLHGKLKGGKVSFSREVAFPATEKHTTTVYFTEEAWAKQNLLLDNFDKEVAWHGVAERMEDPAGDYYLISDIMVYPQKVTGATVEMDETEYNNWIIDHADDERFNKIRMQGHSHVRMATNPSAVDLNHQDEIVNMLRDDDFYIFMIWNKSLSRDIKIYDMKKNIFYDNADVEVKILGSYQGFDAFLAESKAMVKEKAYSYTGASKSKSHKTAAGSEALDWYTKYGIGDFDR